MVMTSISSDPPRTLIEWRLDAAYTQLQAAKYLRISQAFYSKLERGCRHASGPMAAKLHAKTHVPIAVLVGAA